jgi:ParB family chromosome partitioning protein
VGQEDVVTVTKTLKELAADKEVESSQTQATTPEPGRGDPGSLPAPESNGTNQPTTIVDTPHSYEHNLRLPVDSIQPNPANPRRDTAPDEGLVESIRTHGLIEPLVVRPLPKGDDGRNRFELLAGHRRLAAVKAAGFTRVPCVYRHVDDAGALEIALVENLHRKDLSPMELAGGIGDLVKLGKSQREIGALLGFSQPVISKRLALLKLPEVARAAVDSGGITLEDGIGLAKLDEKTVAGLFKSGRPAHYEIDQALRRQEGEEKRAKVIARLQKDGVTVTKKQPGWNREHAPCRLHSIDLNEKAHKTEPCHAVHVDAYGYETACCTEPTRHPETTEDEDEKEVFVQGKGWTPITELTDKERSALEKEKAAEQAAKFRRAQREADKSRRDAWIKRRLTDYALLAARPSEQHEVIALAAMFLLRANTNAGRIADRLSYDGKKSASYTQRVDWVRGQTGDKTATQLRVLYAMALDAAEERMPSAWYDPVDGERRASDRFYLQHLEAHGYALSGTERELLEDPQPEDAAAESPVGDDTSVRSCRACGCTDAEACDGGCSWVEDDLCSECLDTPRAATDTGGEGSPAEAPAVTIARPGRAKKWTVTCTACGDLGKNTTEEFANDARAHHLAAVHDIETP